MTPKPDPELLRQALATFDAAMRNSVEWAGWEDRRGHKYAIEVDGHRYPVKQILSMATGQPTSTFYGGTQGANKVVAAAGFNVVSLRDSPLEEVQPMMRFRDAVADILSSYEAARADAYSGTHAVMQKFEDAARALAAIPEVVPKKIKVVPSAGKGNWAGVPWISMLDPQETDSTQKGVYIVYLFCADMTGVYATLNQGVTEFKDLPSKQRPLELINRANTVRSLVPTLKNVGFALDNQIDLHTSSQLGMQYQTGTIAHKFYPVDQIPDADELGSDIHALLDAYEIYVSTKTGTMNTSALPISTLSSDFESLLANIAATGFVFEPWQLAAYVTAIRTKPFVILAGVSGTGKSKLPQLVATATGGQFSRIAVRPDWTDSSDVLGYVDLRGEFRPGSVLQFAERAEKNLDRHHVCLLDEMNLARVEQYFAELLSGMEDRSPVPGGGFASPPLLVQKLNAEDAAWSAVGSPANLALIGTVNMDESTHGFSRKVLDRAFTLEMSDVDLGNWKEASTAIPEANMWPIERWYPRGIRLSDLRNLTTDESLLIKEVVDRLIEANGILAGAQVQVGYRVRDEIALFVLHARELQPWFCTQLGDAVDPLDLALHMKILPRLAGGSGAIRRVLLQLLGWSVDGKANLLDDDLAGHATRWDNDGRRTVLSGARLPRTAARLCLMWDRLQQEGFTSYWL